MERNKRVVTLFAKPKFSSNKLFNPKFSTSHDTSNSNSGSKIDLFRKVAKTFPWAKRSPVCFMVNHYPRPKNLSDCDSRCHFRVINFPQNNKKRSSSYSWLYQKPTNNKEGYSSTIISPANNFSKTDKNPKSSLRRKNCYFFPKTATNDDVCNKCPDQSSHRLLKDACLEDVCVTKGVTVSCIPSPISKQIVDNVMTTRYSYHEKHTRTKLIAKPTRTTFPRLPLIKTVYGSENATTPASNKKKPDAPEDRMRQQINNHQTHVITPTKTAALRYKMKTPTFKANSLKESEPAGAPRLTTHYASKLIHRGRSVLSFFTNRPDSGKQLLRQVLFSIIVMTWSPCILMLCLSWCLSHPFKAKHLISSKNRQLDTHGQKTKAEYRCSLWSKFTSKPFVTSSRRNLIKNNKQTYAFHKRTHNHKQTRQPHRRQKKHPDCQIKYTLCHASGRGWVIKPIRKNIHSDIKRIRDRCFQNYRSCFQIYNCKTLKHSKKSSMRCVLCPVINSESSNQFTLWKPLTEQTNKRNSARDMTIKIREKIVKEQQPINQCKECSRLIASKSISSIAQKIIRPQRSRPRMRYTTLVHQDPTLETKHKSVLRSNSEPKRATSATSVCKVPTKAGSKTNCIECSDLTKIKSRSSNFNVSRRLDSGDHIEHADICECVTNMPSRNNISVQSQQLKSDKKSVVCECIKADEKSDICECSKVDKKSDLCACKKADSCECRTESFVRSGKLLHKDFDLCRSRTNSLKSLMQKSRSKSVQCLKVPEPYKRKVASRCCQTSRKSVTFSSLCKLICMKKKRSPAISSCDGENELHEIKTEKTGFGLFSKPYPHRIQRTASGTELNISIKRSRKMHEFLRSTSEDNNRKSANLKKVPANAVKFANTVKKVTCKCIMKFRNKSTFKKTESRTKSTQYFKEPPRRHRITEPWSPYSTSYPPFNKQNLLQHDKSYSTRSNTSMYPRNFQPIPHVSKPRSPRLKPFPSSSKSYPSGFPPYQDVYPQPPRSNLPSFPFSPYPRHMQPYPHKLHSPRPKSVPPPEQPSPRTRIARPMLDHNLTTSRPKAPGKKIHISLPTPQQPRPPRQQPRALRRSQQKSHEEREENIFMRLVKCLFYPIQHCLIDPIKHADRDAWEDKHTECNNFAILSMRKTPGWWLFKSCPKCYPEFLLLRKSCYDCFSCVMMCLFACIWCPCIVACYYVCYGFCRVCI